MSLYAKLRHRESEDNKALRLRYGELEEKMRDWPRTAQNDPFSSEDVARFLEAGGHHFLAFSGSMRRRSRPCSNAPMR